MKNCCVSGMKKTDTILSYAIAVLKSATVVGHLPRKISTLCSLFIRRGGAIHCNSSSPRVQYRISFKNLNIRKKLS